MDEREIAIWSSLSAEPDIEAVAHAGHVARGAWLRLIFNPIELRELEMVNRHRPYEMTAWGAGEAAANVAIEVAIILDLWPLTVDEALRRPRLA